VVTYRYDLVGRLIAVSDPSASMMTPSGASASYATNLTYDQVNRPLAVTFEPAPAQITPSASSVVSTFGYDATNRRVSETTTDNSWWNYPTSASSVSYTANALNQYTAVGAVTPTYDGNGNLTSDGVFTLGYDAENRLVSASGPGVTASYAYDAQGRRKSKAVNGATTIFVTDADNREVLEYDGATGRITCQVIRRSRPCQGTASDRPGSSLCGFRSVVAAPTRCRSVPTWRSPGRV
jgi:YD repeat-containing protein